MDLPPCTVKQETIECEKLEEEEVVLEDEIHLASSYQSDQLRLVRITCHGNLNEPSFPRRLRRITSRLKFLLSNGKEPLKVAKVEPWNSVRVTFNLSQDAAQRLQQLAEHGEHLRELGILSVQIEGQQVISLRLPNQNNIAPGTSTVDSATCHNSVNIAQNNDKITNKEDNEISLKELKQSSENNPSLSIIAGSGNKYLYEQLNGAIGGDENSNSSHSSSIDHLAQQSSVDSQVKVHPYHGGVTNTSAVGQQLTCQVLAPKRPATEIPSTSGSNSQLQRVAIPAQFHVSQVQSRTNSLLVPSSQANADYQSPQQPNSYMSSVTTVNTSSHKNVMASDPSLYMTKSELSRAIATPAVMVSQACVQSSQPCPSSQSSSVASSVTLQNPQQQSQLPPLSQQHPQSQQLPTNGTISIRNNSPANQFAKQIPSMVQSKPPQSTPQVFVSSQNSVPIVSSLQSQHFHSVKIPNTLSIVTSTQTQSSLVSSSDLPFGPNGSSLNIFSTGATIRNNVLYQTSKPPISSVQPTTSATSIEDSNLNKVLVSDEAKLERNNQTPSVLDLNPSDILGSSVDAVDEDLLDSVAATGADSLDLRNLNDLNVQSMLEEMESAPQSHVSQGSTVSSQNTIQSNISLANDASQVGGESTVSSTPPIKSEEEFSSPNVVAPPSTQPLPFLIAQSLHQSSPKVGASVATGQLLINSSTGTVVGQTSLPKSQQTLGSSNNASQSVSTTIYPFTSMHHASIAFRHSSNQNVPKHVFLPVRQISNLRASNAPQTPVSIARTLSSSSSAASDLLVQQAQQTLYRSTANQHAVNVQSVQSPNPNATSLPGTSQPSSSSLPPQQSQQTQQILTIRQASNFNASTSAQTSNTSSGQSNTVALSSPLLVNLLQSEVQPNTSLPQSHQQNMSQSQTTQFISTTGQQIRLINQSGAPVEGGGPLMMMVRVSTAQNGATQFIHPVTGSVVATVSNSQVATSVASQVVDPPQQQVSTPPTETSAPPPPPKPKRVRKPRKPKNQPEVNQDNSQLNSSSTSQTISQNINKNQSGIISNIPITVPTTRVQTTLASATTILTIPTSSVTQTLKFHPSQVQGLVQSQMSGQQVFNQQKQRGPPVMVITTSNSNLISSVSNAVESAATPSSSGLAVSSASTFFVVGTSSASVTSVSSTNTSSALLSSSIQQSGNRQKIILATKSNSFPVSNALSRISTNTSASSTPGSLITSPIKLVTQSPSSSITLPNSSSSSSIANSTSDPKTVSVGTVLPSTSSKSSLTTMVSSSTPGISPSTNNATNFVQGHVSVSGSDLSSINVSMLQTSAGNTFFNTNTSNSIAQPKLLSQNLESQGTRTSQANLQSPSKSPPLQLTSVSAPGFPIKTFQVSQQPGVNASTLLFNKVPVPNSISGPALITSALAQFPSKGQHSARVSVSQLSQTVQKQIVAKTRLESSGEEQQISILNTSDGNYTLKRTPESIMQVENKFRKVDNLESLLSTHESKETSKSISQLNYNKLEDMLASDVSTSKLDSVFTDVDCERISEEPAPISPSYFLASTSPKVEKHVNEPSFSPQKSESSTSKEVNVPEVQKGETSKEEQSKSAEIGPVSSNTESKIENSIKFSLSTIVSSTGSVFTKNESILSKSSDNALKSNKTPYNFYLSKHNFSQDLPDHILEDDDEDGDDSDTDDFGFFLSGNIGSIGRNAAKNTIGSIGNSSSTFSTVVPSLSTISKPPESISNTKDSATENEEKSSVSNETTSSTSKVNVSDQQTPVSISQSSSSSFLGTISGLNLNNEKSLPVSHATSSKTLKSEESTHTIVNGDVLQHTETIFACSDQSSIANYRNGQASSFSLSSVVASKSLPSSTAITSAEHTTKSMSESHIVAQKKLDATPKKTEVQQNSKNPALATPKASRARKPSLSSPKITPTKPTQASKSPGGTSKARNRGKNSTATTPKNDPDLNSTSHTEFQSLLASSGKESVNSVSSGEVANRTSQFMIAVKSLQSDESVQEESVITPASISNVSSRFRKVLPPGMNKLAPEKTSVPISEAATAMLRNFPQTSSTLAHAMCHQNQQALNQISQQLMHQANQQTLNQPDQQLVNELNQQALNQSNQQLVNEANQQALNQPNQQLVNQPNQQPVSQSSQQPVSQSSQQSLSQLNQQPVSQLNQQPVSQSSQQPVIQPIQKSLSQPIQQPVNQLNQKSVNQPIPKAVSQPISKAISQPIQKLMGQSIQQPVMSRFGSMSGSAARVRTPSLVLVSSNSMTSPQLKLMASPSKTVSASTSQQMYIPVHSSSSGQTIISVKSGTIASSEFISKIDSNDNSETNQLSKIVVARKSSIPNVSTHTLSLETSNLLTSHSSSQSMPASESNVDKNLSNSKLTNTDISSSQLSQDLNSNIVSISSTVTRSQPETPSTLQKISLVDTLSTSKVGEIGIYPPTNCTDQAAVPTSSGYLEQSNSMIVLKAKPEVVGNSLLLKAREEAGIASKQVATTRVPQTVQILVNDTNSPNLVFLRDYKIDKDHILNQIRPKIVIAKPSSLAQQLNSSAEIPGAIYATKSSQSLTATKVLPSILSKSKTKRKSDTSLTTLTSQQMQPLAINVETSTNFAQQQSIEDHSSGIYSKTNELIQNRLIKSKPFKQQTSDQGGLLGESGRSEVAEEPATKTRKRARKSKVTTMEQPISSTLNTSAPMVLNFTNLVGHTQELAAEQAENAKNTNSGNSRVLRKTSPAKSLGNKRGSPRNNRSMLVSTAPATATTESTSVESEETAKTNEKTRKGRDASKQASRPTRSNRSRKKSNEPALIVTNSEIVQATSTSASIFSQSMPTVEVPGNEMILTSGSIHIPVATSALISQNSSSLSSPQINPTASSSANIDSSRSISLLDSTSSILAKPASRTRKSNATFKPSLRSNATQDAEVNPSPAKRRRVAKDANK